MNKKFYNSFDDLFESLSDQKHSSIFRGQSNTDQFWNIKSSFNRKYKYLFHKRSLSLRDYLKNYKDIREYDELIKLNDIDLLVFLQHYGFPTPLIDFTKNPFKAFYFACSDISYPFRSRMEFFKRNDNLGSSEYSKAYNIALKCSNGNRLTSDEFITLFNYQKNFFVSLIQFETKQLSSTGFLIDIKENSYQYDYDFLHKCRKNKLAADEGIEGYIFSILEPIENDINNNLTKQEGVFLYFDSSLGLNEFSTEFGFNNAITYHLIPKPSLNLSDSTNNGRKTIFSYLKEKKISGMELFNNLQGFQFDFLNLGTGE